MAETGTGGDENFLRIEGVSKSFGSVHVVDNLTLGVAKGEFVSILGPSGCGKTTTLRMVAGFFDPDAGTVWLDGARIDNRPSHQRGAAMVFQNYALFPHMTVFDNVAFGLRMHKVPKPDIAPRVADALELVRLPQLGGRYPRELSGGQQQRVALARAIVLRPKLLLLDEPLSNLDAKLRKELRFEFLEIHRRARITTLFVTHDLEEAFSMSDRVAVMNHGKVEQYEEPIKIFTRPRTAFVSEFVGHSNVLEGTIAGLADGEATLQANGFTFTVPAQGPVGRRVRMVIPAHALRLKPASAQPSARDIQGKLVRLAYLGSTVQFAVEAANLTLSGEMHATAESMRHREGDAVVVSWSVEDLIELPVSS